MKSSRLRSFAVEEASGGVVALGIIWIANKDGSFTNYNGDFPCDRMCYNDFDIGGKV